MTEPELLTVRGEINVCAACLDGEGGECHTPGCLFWIVRAPDLPLRSRLTEIFACTVEPALEAKARAGDEPSAKQLLERFESVVRAEHELVAYAVERFEPDEAVVFAADIFANDALGDIPSYEGRGETPLEALAKVLEQWEARTPWLDPSGGES